LKVSRPLRRLLATVVISLPIAVSPIAISPIAISPIAISPIAIALPVAHAEDKPTITPPASGEQEGEGHEGGSHEGGSRIDDVGEHDIAPIIFVIGAITIAAFLAYRVGRRRGSSGKP
jgi:hypothetical protein